MKNKVGYVIIEMKSIEKDGKCYVFDMEHIHGIPYNTKDECIQRLDEVCNAFKVSHEKYHKDNIVVSKRLGDDSYCFGFENKKSRKGINYVIFQIIEVPIP